jgi:hypothetical protein
MLLSVTAAIAIVRHDKWCMSCRSCLHAHFYFWGAAEKEGEKRKKRENSLGKVPQFVGARYQRLKAASTSAFYNIFRSFFSCFAQQFSAYEICSSLFSDPSVINLHMLSCQLTQLASVSSYVQMGERRRRRSNHAHLVCCCC